jgi:hypothetical protein
MARVTTTCILFGNRNEGQRKAAVCHNDTLMIRAKERLSLYEVRARRTMGEQIFWFEGPLWESM